MGLLINDTTYAGEVASSFIVKAITGSDTIQGGNVYVKDGIKKKFTIPRIQVSGIIQDPAATPVSKGDVKVDGKVLDPEDYLIYLEFNPNDFEDHWFATELDAKLMDRRLPITVESALIQEVLKLHANYVEKALWQSKKTNLDSYKYFDGFLKKMLDNADVLDVAGAVTLTAANIVSKFDAAKLLIPASIKNNPNLKYFVSPATFELYGDAQKAQANKGMDFTSSGQYTYNGKRVVVLNGMPDNTIVAGIGTAGLDSNLWVGMNSKSDNEVKLSPLQANSDNWFIKMKAKLDVNVGFGEEIVMYTTFS